MIGRVCDRPTCTSAAPLAVAERSWITLRQDRPAGLDQPLERHACSVECAHWLIDELGEILPR